MSMTAPTHLQEVDRYFAERVDLAAAFRWAVRLNWHEAVANHFSLAVNESGTQFLMNPNQRHFSLIRASDLLVIDAEDPQTMQQDNAPDPTAWGLHGAIHRNCRHARCALHVHSKYATVLASLADSSMPPIDQNTALFFNRVVIDEQYGGLAFEEEGERCSQLFADPRRKVMIMGNHGVLVIGDSVADAFNRLFYFERAAETLVTAYMTGRPLRVLSDEIAEKTASELDAYPESAIKHFADCKEILDRDEPDYRT
ncbi:MAG: class II aldolase and adducin N-terminal domain-containing protein [Pseudomonadota bacterium]